MKSKTAIAKYYQLFFSLSLSVTQCSGPERFLEPQIHHKIIKQAVKSWVRGAGAWRTNVLLGVNSFQLETTARALLSSRFIVYWCDLTGSVWHRLANLSRGKNPKCKLSQQAAFLYTWKLEFSRISTRATRQPRSVLLYAANNANNHRLLFQLKFFNAVKFQCDVNCSSKFRLEVNGTLHTKTRLRPFSCRRN